MPYDSKGNWQNPYDPKNYSTPSGGGVGIFNPGRQQVYWNQGVPSFTAPQTPTDAKGRPTGPTTYGPTAPGWINQPGQQQAPQPTQVYQSPLPNYAPTQNSNQTPYSRSAPEMPTAFQGPNIGALISLLGTQPATTAQQPTTSSTQPASPISPTSPFGTSPFMGGAGTIGNMNQYLSPLLGFYGGPAGGTGFYQ